MRLSRRTLWKWRTDQTCSPGYHRHHHRCNPWNPISIVSPGRERHTRPCSVRMVLSVFESLIPSVLGENAPITQSTLILFHANPLQTKAKAVCWVFDAKSTMGALLLRASDATANGPGWNARGRSVSVTLLPVVDRSGLGGLLGLSLLETSLLNGLVVVSSGLEVGRFYTPKNPLKHLCQTRPQGSPSRMGTPGQKRENLLPFCFDLEERGHEINEWKTKVCWVFFLRKYCHNWIAGWFLTS
jgi:hypothetical protein